MMLFSLADSPTLPQRKWWSQYSSFESTLFSVFFHKELMTRKKCPRSVRLGKKKKVSFLILYILFQMHTGIPEHFTIMLTVFRDNLDIFSNNKDGYALLESSSLGSLCQWNRNQILKNLQKAVSLTAPRSMSSPVQLSNVRHLSGTRLLTKLSNIWRAFNWW